MLNRKPEYWSDGVLLKDMKSRRFLSVLIFHHSNTPVLHVDDTNKPPLKGLSFQKVVEISRGTRASPRLGRLCAVAFLGISERRKVSAR